MHIERGAKIQHSGARERLAALRRPKLEPCAIGGGERVREFERRHSGRRPLRDHKDRQGGGSARARELAIPGGAGISGPPARNPNPRTLRSGIGRGCPAEAPNSANKRGNMEHQAALTLRH
ncbi:hypothetical protein NDU88_005151 [Pleurodeles waltl]|uniref:Uncharacterized protein n=1 Tax=Pleurodeles waltl TaxID=8319 RepID=A0AAV7TUP4_PLEWA|nr:hypothetical protein NDU88_005151 [Pleurodeles waltl]